ncbi:MAG: hypothetical protein CVT86_08545, partial [Alphaproteobacteria bacterium HGW-Alphaproteobacteria-8]
MRARACVEGTLARDPFRDLGQAGQDVGREGGFMRAPRDLRPANPRAKGDSTVQMRPPNKNRNNRNKSGRKPMGNASSRVYESAGPEGKVRGTPQQIIEKYLNMARDSQTSGDRVMSENFLQHAEHYIRILSAAQQQLDDQRLRGQSGGARDGDDASREDDFEGFADRFTQPERVVQQQPEERAAQPANGAALSTDPRDQQREHDRPRREHGQERGRDQDRPRREPGEDRPRRERNEDRPRRDDRAPRVETPAAQPSESLETIDPVDAAVT